MHVHFILGRLTRDPESRTTGTGKTVCNFAIARNEDKDTAVYYECTAWEGIAEFVMQYFKKGYPIGVVARKKVNTFTGRDGEEHSKDVYTVVDASFLPGGNGNVKTEDDEEKKPAAKTPKKQPKAKVAAKPEEFEDDEDDESSVPF